MRAVVAREPGGAEALAIEHIDEPVPADDELLVQVVAAGVNRADINQREGKYRLPEGVTEVLGLEAAGHIVAVGRAVEGWNIGDEVCALLAGGCYADRIVVPASTALPWPESVDAIGAAGVYEVFATAYDNVFVRAGLATGEALLVHGGSSGVGTAAIQLAKRAGCRVIVTVGTEEKAEACRALGADECIVYKQDDFVESVARMTSGRGVDVILDVVGGEYLDRNLHCLALEGRLVIIALMGGARAELDLRTLLSRRGRIISSTIRTRTVDEKSLLAAGLLGDVWPGFADGQLEPVIDSTFALERVADAHRRMESSQHIGKIILTMDD